MSRKDKSQGEASGVDSNLVEEYRSATEAERQDINNSPSVTRESQEPSASIFSTGINAESRLKIVRMDTHKRSQLPFLYMRYSLL